MTKLSLAITAGALALLATPAAAQHYGHGHGHGYGHAAYGHVQQHGHYGHHAHQPSYGHARYATHYVQPHAYVAPVTTYEKRPAYVYQKVAGYCLDAVKSSGYGQHRRTVECKAGEYQQPAAKVVQAEPAPAPVEEVPQK